MAARAARRFRLAHQPTARVGRLAADPAFSDAISSANKLLAKPLADVPDSLFLEFSQTGNRTHWQNAEFARRERIARFTLAEACENQGRFLPALEKTIAALGAEKTWQGTERR